MFQAPLSAFSKSLFNKSKTLLSADSRVPSALGAQQATEGATGDAGELTINTRELLIQDGAVVNASTFGVGKGGNLTVTANTVQLIGITADGQSARSSGLRLPHTALLLFARFPAHEGESLL